MRVAIDAGPITPEATGVGSYTRSLLEHLLAANPPDISFCCYSSGRHAKVDLGPNLPHRHLRVPTRLLYKSWEVSGRPRADKLVGGADVVHATNYFLPPVHKARRVLTVYDLAFLKAPQWGSPRIVGPFGRNIERFAKAADAIITSSEASRRDVVELLHVRPEQVHVAYGAVSKGIRGVVQQEAQRWLGQHHRIDAPFVLYVGTLEPRKNIEGMLQAFARVQNDCTHSLVLVGRLGWGMEHLDHMIADLGIAQRVRRIGYLPRHEDLSYFYSAADALFFPSFYEGFGLPAVEAMYCGCPLITSDRGALAEVAGDAAAVVDPDDIGEMASALRSVLKSEHLRESLSDKGLLQARHFTWEETAARTLDVYRSLA